jgi:alkanesulfonate monooxygenase SsuD/methylene tetrahydromethanopterin reductase-like flavin-dependent oxidoreductase (luciferase family)
VPIWYGGLSYKAVELAVELGDGWIPSRIPLDRLRERVIRARDLLGSASRIDGFTFAATPQTALGANPEAALARFDLAKVMAEALHRKPVSGGRQSLSLPDLEGYLIWGSAADICGYVDRFLAIGVTHIVFDMRSSFGDFLEHVRILGQEVLPRFR